MTNLKAGTQKKNYQSKYAIKRVYHRDKERLGKLEKIAFKMNRSYNDIMNELSEKFVLKNEHILTNK